MENSIQLKEQIEQYLNNNIDNTTMFVVDVKVLPTNKIEVFIDRSDTNITIDECAKTSRKLEEYLESNQLVGEKYTLEVSSPGMDQPFKVLGQYKRRRGRPVKILLKDGKQHAGILVDVNEQELQLLETIKEKIAGKKVEKQITTTMPMQNIKETKLEFK